MFGAGHAAIDADVDLAVVTVLGLQGASQLLQPLCGQLKGQTLVARVEGG